VWYILTSVSEMLTVSIIWALDYLIMEAVSSSETLVNICQTTWCNIPEDSHLHTCDHKNLKSHRQHVVPDQILLQGQGRVRGSYSCYTSCCFSGLFTRILPVNAMALAFKTAN
jgi:hypothetical protein